MITKGIITSIDFNGNTCEVRMPYFENAGNDKITGTATISNIPGMYNGYKVNDVVWVAFEDGLMNTPVVIGKLYLGASVEKEDPRGTLNVETSSVAKTATIPADTVLASSVDKNVSETTQPFGSLFSVANELNSLKTNVSEQAKYNNSQIESVLEEISRSGTTLMSKIVQNYNAITLEVAERERADTRLAEDADKALRSVEADMTLKAGKIAADVGEKVSRNSQDEVGSYNGFGWDLSLDGWSVYKKVDDHGSPVASNVVFSKKLEWDPSKGTYYFTNNKYWKDGTVYCYAWNSGHIDDPHYINAQWPGVLLTDYELNEYGEKVYSALIDASIYDHVIFSGVQPVVNPSTGEVTNWPAQTEDLSILDLTDYQNAWYIRQSVEHPGREDTLFYDCGKWVKPMDSGDSRNYSWYVTINNHRTSRPCNATDDVSTLKVKLQVVGGKNYWFWDEPSNPTYNNQSTGVEADSIKPILFADEKGLSVFGTIEAIDGHISNFNIGQAKDADTGAPLQNGSYGIYSDGYITNYSQTPSGDGVYIGTDGIKLGQYFSLDDKGNLAAANAVLTGGTKVAGYTKATHKKYCRISESTASAAASNHSSWWNTWAPTGTETGSVKWQDTAPDREDGKYIWEWTKDEKGDDRSDHPEDWDDLGKVCITGAKGSTGDTGASVTECKTYYSLSNTSSASGPATGDSNIVSTPAVNKWSTSPQTFNKSSHQGYVYWTVERRVYANPSSVVWGTPVKASMLSVAFIDSLGITAEKITVQNNGTTLFNADASTGVVTMKAACIDGAVTAGSLRILDTDNTTTILSANIANESERQLRIGPGNTPFNSYNSGNFWIKSQTSALGGAFTHTFPNVSREYLFSVEFDRRDNNWMITTSTAPAYSGTVKITNAAGSETYTSAPFVIPATQQRGKIYFTGTVPAGQPYPRVAFASDSGYPASNGLDTTLEVRVENALGTMYLDSNGLSAGTVGSAGGILLTTKSGQNINLSGTQVEDCAFTIGKYFGVTRDGEFYATKGLYTGDLRTKNSILQDVKQFSFTKTSSGYFKIDDIDLVGSTSAAGTVTTQTVTFRITDVRGSYIGGNTLYTVTVKAYDSNNNEVQLRDGYTTLPVSYVVLNKARTGSGTVSFSPYVTVKIPAGGSSGSASWVDSSYEQYGDWTLDRATFVTGTDNYSASNIATVTTGAVKTLNIGGNVYAEAFTTPSSSSDKRLKYDINYGVDNLEPIFDELKPAVFKYKEEQDLNINYQHWGFIAQDINESLKLHNISLEENAITHIFKDDYYMVDYRSLHALEVDQIQKLKKRVSQLESELQEIKEIIKKA